MINLKNDYCYIAHPLILEKLNQNREYTYNGYGFDEYTTKAVNLIKETFKCRKANVYFLPGGTITNKIAIAHSLKPYEAVICVDSGHINTHETGAIEQTGHKILVVKNHNGKVWGSDVEELILKHTDEHMVKPKMLYISNPTEYGTIYTLEEIKKLHALCEKYDLYFYIDGARLATALTASTNDIKAQDLAKYVDIFYIGGTKNGLMMGEALVIVNEKLKAEFRYSLKHFGGLFAKGFLCGIQFITLFENNLFFQIGTYQNQLAAQLTEGLKKLNVQFLMPTETNQIFVTLDNDIIKKLQKNIMFEIWEEGKTSSTIRLVVHYNLKPAQIEEVIQILKQYLEEANVKNREL